jgi:D-amino-acid oxidase
MSPVVMPPRLGRRAWLKQAAAGCAGLALAGCAPRPVPLVWPPPGRPRTFARVNVSPDRVIRTVAGLRPFRRSGFVVRAERLDGRTIVHNYGHGGGGITLSWGTAHLAADEALQPGEQRFAVIGCGAVGLATARLLQRRGGEVTIYARDLPPATTSNMAGAQWSPFTVADPDSRTAAFDDQFDRAVRLSSRYFQDLVGDRYGVRWIENYALSDDRPEPGRGARRGIEDLFPDTVDLARHEHPFPVRYARRFATMFIDMPVYLEAVLQDFRLMGGRLVVREFSGLPELLAVDEPVIVNCTGLGARALFQDEELTPIKGQLSVLLPQPEVDYLTLYGGLYMFPRRDGILLGGTFERGVWTLEPNEAETRRILDGHQRFFAAMR